VTAWHALWLNVSRLSGVCSKAPLRPGVIEWHNATESQYIYNRSTIKLKYRIWNTLN
jgi:hypothetical protein